MFRSRLFLLPLAATLFICAQMIRPKAKHLEQFVTDADAFYAEALSIMDGVPGAAITIVKDGRTLYQKGFGYADLKNKRPFTAQTNYYIASCTKAFTALMAMRLHDQGLIPLDSKLVDYFPDIEFSEDIPVQQVSVRDLLTHTSGLRADPISFRLAYTGDHSFQQLLELLGAIDNNRVGYGNFQYTNEGYNIYGLIVERVTGKPWQDVLSDTVLRPLDLKRTTAYMSEAERHNWPMALPYSGLDKNNIEELYLRKRDNTMQSAGGIITNAEDMAQWLKIQLGRGQVDEHQLIDAELIAYTHQRLAVSGNDREPFPSEAYGLGWHIGNYQGQEAIWHFGGFAGSMTHISFVPEAGIGVAVFINDDVAGFRLMNLFATYAYDYFLKGSDATNGEYRSKVKEMKQELVKASERYKKELADRTKRQWQLAEGFPAYAGTYVNDQYGTINIKGRAKGMHVNIGNLQAEATPFTRAETARVELIPGQGIVLNFIRKDGELTGLELRGTFYRKVE